MEITSYIKIRLGGSNSGPLGRSNSGRREPEKRENMFKWRIDRVGNMSFTVGPRGRRTADISVAQAAFDLVIARVLYQHLK